ncbi:hypothetical protein D7I41_20240 [Ochrobactrum sp. MH181795]|nr:hypothetical protein D7I41_20240 [Ochrobactrum sp. MH181795]
MKIEDILDRKAFKLNSFFPPPFKIKKKAETTHLLTSTLNTHLSNKDFHHLLFREGMGENIAKRMASKSVHPHAEA